MKSLFLFIIRFLVLFWIAIPSFLTAQTNTNLKLHEGIDLYNSMEWDSLLLLSDSFDVINSEIEFDKIKNELKLELLSHFWLEERELFKEKLERIVNIYPQLTLNRSHKDWICFFRKCGDLLNKNLRILLEEGDKQFYSDSEGKINSEFKNYYTYIYGNANFLSGRYGKAILIFENLLQKLEKERGQNTSLLLYTNFDLGRSYSYSKEQNSALNVFKRLEALAKSKIRNDHPFFAKLYMELGWLVGTQGRSVIAIKELEKAKEIFEKNGFKNSSKAGYYYRLGVILSQSDPDRAIGYYNNILELHDIDSSFRARKLEIPKTQSNIALAYENLRNYDLAVKYLKLAIKNYKQFYKSKHPSLAKAYMNLGRMFAFKSIEDSSLFYHRKGIEVIEGLKMEKRPISVMYYYHYGDALEKFNRNKEAQKVFNQALEVLTDFEGEDRFRSYTTLARLAKLAVEDNKITKARDYLNSALEFFYESKEQKKSNNFILSGKLGFKEIIETLHLKSRIELLEAIDGKKGTTVQKALESYLNTLSAIDSLKVSIINRKSKYSFFEEYANIFNESLELAYVVFTTSQKPFNFSSSFLIAEKKRSTTLLSNIHRLDKLDVDRFNSSIESIKLLEEIVSQNEDLINHYTSKGDSLLAEQAKRNRFQAQKSYDSLKYALEEANPAFARSKYNSKVISLDELQSTLSPSETLLEYFRTDTALYAFAINREDVSFQKLALPENFDPELDQFLANSKSPPKNNTAFKEYYAGKAHELYQSLVEPLLDSLKDVSHQGTSQLIIVPDGKLGYLPWDALLTEMPSDVHDYRNYPLLLKKFSIRQAYSATLMKLLEEKEMEEKALMAAFAPAYMTKSQLAQIFKSGGGEICGPPDEERFEELSQSSQELDEILAHIKGARFDTLNASETRFKEIGNDYRILHLTMHGFTDDCDPMYSGLVFTPRSMLEAAGISDTTNPTNEGILHAYEIYNMRLNAELVVMSACQTGLGKIQAGEGIMSLARAFAHAGSPNTVMSLWQVQESSTRKLMENFYEYLDAGKGKDEALRLAKLDFINGNGIAHPFYWAGFTLIGDDKPIVEDNWFQKNWWMLAIGLVLLLGIYAVLRKYSSSART